MRKFLALLLICLSISEKSFGAVSNDEYLRQDVFSARMDAFMSEIRLMNEQLRSEIKQDIQNVRTEVKQNIENLRTEVKQDIQEIKQELQVTNRRIDATNARIDVTNARLDDLYTMVYWGLALMGIILALITFAPAFINMVQNLRRPSITIEEIEELIERKLMEKLPK